MAFFYSWIIFQFRRLYSMKWEDDFDD